jgi:hypothetical protein
LSWVHQSSKHRCVVLCMRMSSPGQQQVLRLCPGRLCTAPSFWLDKLSPKLMVAWCECVSCVWPLAAPCARLLLLLALWSIVSQIGRARPHSVHAYGNQGISLTSSRHLTIPTLSASGPMSHTGLTISTLPDLSDHQVICRFASILISICISCLHAASSPLTSSGYL